jgi:N-acetylglucosamine-6-phosphate deacetylase
VALVNATVFVAPGRVLTSSTIVMEDGRIVSVQGTPLPPGTLPSAPGHQASKPGEADKAPKDPPSPLPPRGARVFDLAGLTVYPAFIEPYYEIDAPRADPDAKGVHWNERVTPQRTALDGKTLDDATARTLRNAGYGAAALAPRGGIFRGQAAVVSLARIPSDASLSRPPVYAAGVYQMVAMDLGGFGTTSEGRWAGYPDSQMGAIAMIRQTLADAEYRAAQRAAGVASGPNALDALLGEKGGAARPLMLNADNELESLRMLKIAAEFKQPAILLGSGLEFRRLEALAQAGEAGGKPKMVIPLGTPDRPRISSIGDLESLDLRDLMTWEQAPTNPRRLHEAGFVPAATAGKGRDRGRIMDNMRAAIRQGLSEDQALAMLTSTPAEVLGLGKELGTVEAGKRANLIVADGPIFSRRTKIRDMWVDGIRHEVTAPPTRLPGTYTLTLNPALITGDTLQLVIDRENAVTVKSIVTPAARREEGGKDQDPAAKTPARGEQASGGREKSGRARSVVIGEDRVSFVLEHEPFGQPGVWTFAGLIDQGEASVTLSGNGVTAGGEAFTWSAVRSAAVTEPEKGVEAKPETKANAPAAAGAANDKPAEDPVAGSWSIKVSGEGLPPDGIPATLTVKRSAENELSATLTAVMGSAEASTTSFDAGSGQLTVEANVEGAAIKLTATVKAEELTGQVTGPMGVAQLSGNRTARAAAAAPAKREETIQDADRLPGLVGRWQIVTINDRVQPGKPTFIAVQPDGRVTVKRDKGEAAAASAQVQDPQLSYTVDSKPISGAGTVSVKARRMSQLLIGEMTVAGAEGAAATTSAFKAVRVGPADGTQEADKKTLDAVSVPEKLPGLPFGAYAFTEQPAQQRVVFTNATVWTSGPAGRIENGAVVIADGIIQYVGPAASLPRLAEGFVTVDCTGKHITPGLIDCHSHTGISGGVNEAGQAITAEVRIGDVTNPDAINWYRQLAGGLTLVNNLHGSANPIGGQNQVNKIRWGVVRPDDMHMEGAIAGIKFALGENVKQSNSGERSNTRYPQTRMGVETIIRDRFIAAREYAAAWERHRTTPGATPPRRDLELECLAEILANKRLVHCHSYRQDEILMLARVAQEFNFKIGSYQHILEGYKVAEAVRDFSYGGSAFSDWWGFKVEVQDAIPQAGPIMHEAGANVSYNSDSDELARRMNVEAGKAHKYSLLPDGTRSVPPEEALKFVTINPAKQLKVEDRVGSLEVGKDADLVVWNMQPLSTYAKAEQTWIDGRQMFSLEKDAALRAVNREHRLRLTQKLMSERRATDTATPPAADAPAPGETPRRPGAPGGGRRRPLLAQMHEEAFAWRRDLFMDYLRRGRNPADARAGDCGCEELLRQQ